MNYAHPDLLPRLAERFVLGLMARRARRRFGRIVDDNPVVAASVYAVEGTLQPMAWSEQPVAPSELLWPRIARQAGIGVAPPRRVPSRFDASAWRSLAAVASVAFFAAAIGWYQASTRSPEVVVETVVETVPLQPSIGIVSDSGGNPLWVATIYDDLGRADIAVSTPPEAMPSNDYQLWLLRDDGVPVSLGLLPQTGKRSLALDADAIEALSRSATLAVSLEPVGGSPEPIPTGPVLYTTALL